MPRDDAAFDAIDIMKLAKLAGSSAPGRSASASLGPLSRLRRLGRVVSFLSHACVSSGGLAVALLATVESSAGELVAADRLGLWFRPLFFRHLARSAIGVEEPAVSYFIAGLFLVHFPAYSETQTCRPISVNYLIFAM